MNTGNKESQGGLEDVTLLEESCLKPFMTWPRRNIWSGVLPGRKTMMKRRLTMKMVHTIRILLRIVANVRDKR